MNLTSIIIKNVKYNIKNYIAYLLGNSFIICILFMFFNLISSKSFMNAPSTLFVKKDLMSIVAIMVAFSVVFILYTTVSFTKYRGKEFGVYFTIGLTSKNILRILSYENIIVTAASFVFGSIFGTAFSKLFYMAIVKILKIHNINFGINLKAYIYIFAIASLIYVFNTVYQAIFLKTLSISEILKSNSKKGIGKVNSIVGIISIVVLIISMIMFKKLISKQFENNGNYIVASIAAAIIAMYFIIGYAMCLIVKVSKLFKRFYNSNILVLNSLSHRFISYRVVLYLVTLLVSGAMVFMSTLYSTYKSTERYVNIKYPYDLSFIVPKDKYNENFKQIIKSSGAEIKSYNALENIDMPDVRENNNKIVWFNFQTNVVSESNYKKLTEDKVNIENGHAIFYSADKHTTEGGLIINFPKNEKEIKKIMQMPDNVLFKDYVKYKNNEGFLYIQNKNKINREGNITNFLSNSNYSRICSIVINDNDYKKLKENSMNSSIYYDVLVKLSNNDNYKLIKSNLAKRLNKIGGKVVKNSLVMKKEKFDAEFNSRGFELFIYSFLGIMLLMGSAVTLYFKVFTSLNDDRDMVKQLVEIGMTTNEINSIIIKELGAVFIVPPVIAVSLISYYLS